METPIFYDNTTKKANFSCNALVHIEYRLQFPTDDIEAIRKAIKDEITKNLDNSGLWSNNIEVFISNIKKLEI
jgi:hypothetical protein